MQLPPVSPVRLPPRAGHLTVPVRGGDLHVHAWGAGGPVVVLLHGLTANHTEFEALAAQLAKDEVRLIAPDLRGRGRSRDIKGPWGMDAHADDLVAILDHLGIGKADVVLGHSMGGFVAVVAAAHHPTRFDKVLMIDGGFPTLHQLPKNVPVEQVVQDVVGPSMKRLGMRFATRDDYRAFWRSHPAFSADWSEYVERYFDYDLIGEPPSLYSSVRKEAVLGDAESQLVGDLLPNALQAFAQPVRFLRAPRGLMDGEPLYPEALLEHWARAKPDISWTTVPDVNHFTLVMSERGAAVVAGEIRRLL